MKLSAAFIVGATLLGSALGQTKIKFMPLGDSITELQCWRNQIWDNLVSAGLSNNVDFVGSMSNNAGNCRANSGNWDMNHEGHSGYTAIDIANKYLQGWVQNNKPDIVNFMLGTNDITQQKNQQQVQQAYTQILTILRNANPKVKVIVDLLIPISYNPNPGPPQYNSFLKTWAAQNNKTDSPIHIADTNTGFTTQMLRDQVHPNAQGDALIAQRVSPILINLVRQALNGGSEATTTTVPPVTSPATTPAPTQTFVGVPKWGQCGGFNYAGPTVCTDPGTACTKLGDYHWQCLDA